MEDAVATASDQAMRATVRMIQDNAETVQQTLQFGAKLAGQLTERSVDQLGRAIRFPGEGAREVAQKSSHDIEAIAHSGTVWGEITRRTFEEWVNVARARMARGFDHINAFWECRTPQDFAALQSEVFRDNIKTLLGYARKAGEHSARLANEADRRLERVPEVMPSRQDAVGGRRQAAPRKSAHQAASRKSAQKRSARVGGATAGRRRTSR
jgi:hypothetical protein